MNVVRYRPRVRHPFHDLVGLGNEMEKWFDFPFSGESLPAERAAWRPAVDVYEEKGELVVKADLPGLSKDDIDVEVEDDVLTLKGTRQEENESEEGGHYRCERASGAFERTFRLPAGVDASKIKAAFKDGVLTIRLPKAEEAKPRKIKIGLN
jgi:HSP20 family protein